MQTFNINVILIIVIHISSVPCRNSKDKFEVVMSVLQILLFIGIYGTKEMDVI